MPTRCQLCRRVDDALVLLGGLAFRDCVTDEERLPAWRAIKLLYRAGVSKEDCQHLVNAVRMLSKPNSVGPTLRHHLDRVEGEIGRLRWE